MNFVRINNLVRIIPWLVLIRLRSETGTYIYALFEGSSFRVRLNQDPNWCSHLWASIKCKYWCSNSSHLYRPLTDNTQVRHPVSIPALVLLTLGKGGSSLNRDDGGSLHFSFIFYYHIISLTSSGARYLPSNVHKLYSSQY